MAVEIFKLFGSIFVNNDEANRSISKTDEKASSVASTLGKGVKTAAKWGAALVGGASAAAGGIMKLAESSASTADHVDKMSQKIGLSRQAYQELDFICSQTGTSVDSLNGGMKKLTNSMDAAAKGNASANELFDRLGVSIDDGTGKLKSQEDMLYDCLTALQGVNNQTERAALANKLFGKSGTELMPLLNSQSGSIDELKQKAHELGLVMSDEMIDNGVGLTDSLDQTKRAFTAIITTLGGAFMPIVKKVSDHLQSALPFIQNAVNQITPIIGDFFEKILPPLFELASTLLPVIFTAFEQLLPVFQELITTILPIIIDVIQQLAPVFAQIIQQLLPLFVQLIQQLAPFFAQFVSQILPLLVQLINQLLPFIVQIVQTILPVLIGFFQQILPIITQIVSAILPILIDLLGKILPPILQLVETVLPVLQQLFEAIMPLLTMLCETILPIIVSLLKLLTPIIQLLAEMFGGVLGDAIKSITTALQPLFDILNGIITFITNVFKGNWEEAWNGIVKAFKGILNLLPTAVENIINGIIGIINQMIKGIDWVIQVFGWEIPTIPDVQLPRFRAGIDYVPNDKYLAYLDAGEAVLTASEAEEYRKAKRESGTGSPFKAEKTEQKTVNQTFDVTVNVEKIDNEMDIDDLAVLLSQKLAEEVRRTEDVYA